MHQQQDDDLGPDPSTGANDNRTDGPTRSATSSASSFDTWVDQHVASLRGFALVVCGNPSDADDALQEALVRAYIRWVWISRTHDPLRYVRRMIANAHISAWRKHRRRESPISDVFVLVEDTASRATSTGGIAELLSQLTPKQRLVVALRYLDDLSFTEIAKTLRMPESTVRSHHARALKTLQTSPWESKQ
ncbi:RNA polymerase sigma factor [Nocardioides plantarum]